LTLPLLIIILTLADAGFRGYFDAEFTLDFNPGDFFDADLR